MNKSIIYLTLSTSILISCGFSNTNTKYKSSQKLYDEVMAIHDEVMPQMKDIRSLSKQLKKQDVNNIYVQSALEQLDKGHESMMDWMAQFDLPENVTEEEELEYLREQLISVDNMKKDVLYSIEVATGVIQNFEVE